jgi:hypothetical protein
LCVAIGGASAAEISGLPSSYLAKLLSPSPKPARRFGAISLGPVLGVLGLKLVVTTDERAVQKFGSKLEKRQERCVHSNGVHIYATRKFLRKIGAKGGTNSRKNLPKRVSRALARNAAMARWAKAREGNGKADG